MTDFISRDAAAAFAENCGAHFVAKRLMNKEAFPAADVRPVVLCRDCKHWEADWTPRGVSEGRHYCALLDLFPSADWYCSDGEKEADMKGGPNNEQTTETAP